MATGHRLRAVPDRTGAPGSQRTSAALRDKPSA